MWSYLEWGVYSCNSQRLGYTRVEWALTYNVTEIPRENDQVKMEAERSYPQAQGSKDPASAQQKPYRCSSRAFGVQTVPLTLDSRCFQNYKMGQSHLWIISYDSPRKLTEGANQTMLFIISKMEIHERVLGCSRNRYFPLDLCLERVHKMSEKQTSATFVLMAMISVPLT